MKIIKRYLSLFIYGFVGLIIVSCLLCRFIQIKHSPQNSLALPTSVPERLVSMKGKLILKLFPGPPEYSSVENGDRADWCWILKLDETFFLKATTSAVAAPANTLDNINKWLHPDEILLVLEDHMKHFCQRYQNQEILSVGYLFHAHTIHHYTPILMDVKKLKVCGTKMGQQDITTANFKQYFTTQVEVQALDN